MLIVLIHVGKHLLESPRGDVAYRKVLGGKKKNTKYKKKSETGVQHALVSYWYSRKEVFHPQNTMQIQNSKYHANTKFKVPCNYNAQYTNIKSSKYHANMILLFAWVVFI